MDNKVIFPTQVEAPWEIPKCFITFSLQCYLVIIQQIIYSSFLNSIKQLMKNLNTGIK